MNNKDDKNIIDKFLEGYTVANRNVSNTTYKKSYQKPSKFKCIFGFIFSLIVFIILIRVFRTSILFFFILIGDLLCLIFYGVNLFTKKGIGIPKYVKDNKEDYDKKHKVQ